MRWKNLSSETTTFFITATITEWKPLLAKPFARDVLLDDWNFYRKKHNARIYAYTIMPEHYHLILELNKADDLQNWLRNVQGHTSSKISRWLRDTATPEELAIYVKHANGSSKLAVWKEQARAVGITSERVLKTKIDYIHKNPLRRKLVDDPGEWMWSSWRNYYLDDDSVFRVDRVDWL